MGYWAERIITRFNRLVASMVKILIAFMKIFFMFFVLAMVVSSYLFVVLIFFPAVWAVCYFGGYGYLLGHEVMSCQIDDPSMITSGAGMFILVNFAALRTSVISMLVLAFFAIAPIYISIRKTIFITGGLHISLLSIYSFLVSTDSPLVAGLCGAFSATLSFFLWMPVALYIAQRFRQA